MTSLLEILLDRVPPEAKPRLREVADLDSKLATIHARGAETHPDVPVASETWVAFFARLVASEQLEDVLESNHAGDVHLVLACLEGSRAAHARLDAKLRAVATQALIGVRLGAISIDELLQSVRTKLLVGSDGPGKLASYSGRGPLEGWLRVTVTRAALSEVRKNSPEVPGGTDREAFEVAASDDPQLVALRARCGPAIEEAITETVAALDPADKTLFRLHFVDGLTIDDLAVVYRLHRATTARRLARARNLVLDRVRAHVMTSLGIDENEFRSLLGAIGSAIDLTLARVLNTEDEGR